MTYDNFTIKAQESILKAQQIAAELNQQQVDTTHLLKGVLATDEHVATFLLQKMDVNLETLHRKLDEAIRTYPKVTGAEKQFLTNEANRALSTAKRLLPAFGDEYISVEMILLGVLIGNDRGARILKDSGATEEGLRSAVEELRKGKKVTDQSTDNTYNALNKFAVNLNERAESGKLDPIVGRDEEIRRVLHILSRRKKNNPLLIGEAGVGKTAIVEGIAWRIIKGDVPENLKRKKIYTLDLAGLVAGAKFKGEFEERLKGVINEVSGSDEVILFIDEIHTLIGAGGGSGAMDAANILKPALARGELRTIGATTLDEYQKYFEQDAALVRRFQTVVIDEPSIEDTISILRGIQEKYEVYHKIGILDEALIAAAELSDRYISDRFLPDKAIDLVDEAAAKLRTEIDSMPSELDEIMRRIMQLEIEREALKKETDSASKDRLQKIEKELADLKEQSGSLKAQWQNEKQGVQRVRDLKEKLQELHAEIERAERSLEDMRQGHPRTVAIGMPEVPEVKTMVAASPGARSGSGTDSPSCAATKPSSVSTPGMVRAASAGRTMG